MSEFITLEDLKAAGEAVIEPVEIKELGGKKLYIKKLNAGEMLTLWKEGKVREEHGMPNHPGVLLCVQALVNEDGSSLFSTFAEGVNTLMKLPHDAVIEISQKVQGLTPVDDEQIEERAKKSQAPA